MKTLFVTAAALLATSHALWAHPGHSHLPSKAAPHHPAPSKLAPHQPTAPMMHTLSETDAGHTFFLRVGDQIAVKLASNASTGYTWVVLGTDAKVLAVQGQGKYIAPVNHNHMVGVPGSQIWRFKALKPGTSKIQLGYGRTFEKAAPVQTWTATVNVK